MSDTPVTEAEIEEWLALSEKVVPGEWLPAVYIEAACNNLPRVLRQLREVLDIVYLCFDCMGHNCGLGRNEPAELDSWDADVVWEKTVALGGPCQRCGSPTVDRSPPTPSGTVGEGE